MDRYVVTERFDVDHVERLDSVPVAVPEGRLQRLFTRLGGPQSNRNVVEFSAARTGSSAV